MAWGRHLERALVPRPIPGSAAGGPHRELSVTSEDPRLGLSPHRQQQPGPSRSAKRHQQAPDRGRRAGRPAAGAPPLRDRHAGSRRGGPRDPGEGRRRALAVRRRGDPRALQRRRRSVPALAQPPVHSVDVLGQFRALRPAGDPAADRVSARAGPHRRVGESALPGVLGALSRARRGPHAVRDVRRPSARPPVRRVPEDRDDPGAPRRDRRGGARRDRTPRRGPRAVHGARA